MALKALTMRWSGRARAWAIGLGRTGYNYAMAVGNGTGNAAVMACVNWLARAFLDAPLRLRRRDQQGLQPVESHPLLDLIARPNAHYDGNLLWMATIADYLTDGNAYWLKVRSGAGRPVELWWVPSSMIEPRWPEDGSAYLTHYEYRPGGQIINVDPSDVVHFRFGLDPTNPRKGLSPIKSLAREIFTDDEAANFSASLLRNLGVPGVVISPDDEQGLTEEEAVSIRDSFDHRFGNDNRGRTMVMFGKTKITPLSFTPQQMDLKALRRLPEERISAVLGIPAVVAGLGAGLDRSTFANMAEAREAAYEGTVIPTHRLFASVLSAQLLPDYGQIAGLVLDFDLSTIRILQQDQNELAERAVRLYQGGIITRGEARLLVGHEAKPIDDVYVHEVAMLDDPEGQKQQPQPLSMAAD